MSRAAQRIVSLLPSATEIVCALGLEGSLVGVTHECDYPPAVVGKPQLTASRISHRTMTSAEIDHAVRSQLDGHGSIYDLDEVQLRALEPDLILTQELCDVCAVSYRAVEQAARILSAHVEIVSLEPNTIADVLANIRTVGQLTGTQRRAEALVAELTARLDALTRALVDVKHRRGPWCWNGWSHRSRRATGYPSRSRLPAVITRSASQVRRRARRPPRRFTLTHRK